MTDNSEKAPPVTWGYVLLADGRPINKRQRECIALHGVDMSQHGAVWTDKFAGRTTAPRKYLTRRDDLLRAVRAGDSVAVAAPECLGLTKLDAMWFLSELAARDVRLIVNGGSVVIAPGDDAGELTGAIARFQKALTQRRYRSK